MHRRLVLVGLVVATLAGVGIVSSPTATAEFTGPTSFNVGVFAGSAAIGDVTGDGDADIVWGDAFSNDDMYVSEGDGDGGFAPAVVQNMGVNHDGQGITLDDLDGDSDLDVVVSAGLLAAVQIGVNDGSGTFAFSYLASGSNGAQVLTADLNEDGDPDVVRVTPDENFITRWLGTDVALDASFGAASDFAIGLNPWNIAIADFNSDDDLDVIGTVRSDDTVRLLTGNGDGTFNVATIVQGPLGGCDIAALASADFDDDGIADVVFTCEVDEVRVLLGNGDGTFDALGAFTVASQPVAVSAGDFDDDGLPDIAVGVTDQSGLTVWLGDGDGTFTEDVDSPYGAGTDELRMQPQGGWPTGSAPIATGDLDGDGCDDIAATSTLLAQGSVLVSDLCAAPPPPPPPDPGGGGSSRSPAPSVVRSGGDHRYDTAAMSNDDLPRGVDVAYVTTGEDFPDALATGPVAGIEGAALLLVGRDEIPADTAAELERLRPDRIVIVGGVAAVSDAVREQLRDLTDGPVSRIAGVDRYETALELSQAAFDASSDVAYLVSGAGFAEALSAGPAAGLEGGPILLVQGASLDDDVAAELERLSPSTIVLAGGSGSLSVALEADAVRRFGAAVVRAGSFTRYSSGVALAERVLTEESDTIFVSTGEVFADGLAATPWAIREEAPIVLVPADGRLPFRVVDLLEAHPDADIIVIGGTAAVSESLFDELEATRSGA